MARRFSSFQDWKISTVQKAFFSLFWDGMLILTQHGGVGGDIVIFNPIMADAGYILLCALRGLALGNLLALGGVAGIGAGSNVRDAAVLMLDGMAIVHLRIALGESDDTRRMEVAKWSDQIIVGHACWMVRPSRCLSVHGISGGQEQQECYDTGSPENQCVWRARGGEFVAKFPSFLSFSCR